jgi:protein tyrosine phosphatase (PTP) superfamily phosphohydrolase (DUF442 family)
VLVIVALVVAAAAGLWQNVLKERLIVKRWGVVEAGRIYRSGQISRHLIEPTLRRYGIRIVIDLQGDDPTNREQPAERQAIANLGIELRRCPLIGDGTGDIRQYAAAVEAMVDARRRGVPVLVHCYAGTQRTGGVIAMYRLLVEHAAPADVVAELRRYKWDPVRDRILLDYLNEHLQELGGLLVASGTIDRLPNSGLQLTP